MSSNYHSPKLFFMVHIMIFLLFLLFFQSFANDDSSPSIICKDTPFPNFCKSMLPTTGNYSNVYDYGRFSVQKSLSTVHKFFFVVRKYLRHSKNLTVPMICALQDCHFLADLNIDYLSTTFKTVNQTSKILPTLEAEDLQTLLSAILTNTQTCLDGLQEINSTSFDPWSLRNDILAPLVNDTKLHSVSLALFTKGWVPKGKKGTKITQKKSVFRNGHLPLKMSERNKAIFERISRRKLLQQQVDGQVLVSEQVHYTHTLILRFSLKQILIGYMNLCSI